MTESGTIWRWGRRLVMLCSVSVLCASPAWAAETEGGDDPAQEGEVEESNPLDGPEVPEDEWIGDEGEEDPGERGQLDGPRLPQADLEAPEDADPEFEKQLDAYREAYERYTSTIEEYQRALQNMVETEFNRRMAEIEAAFDPRISEAEAIEGQQRNEAITSLEQLLAQYPDDADHTPDALFRLALLYDQREEEEFAAQQTAYFRQLDEIQQQNGDMDELPMPPERSYEESQAMFQRLLADWPGYRGKDLAYYFLAHIEWEQGNWDLSRDLAAELIREAPDSDFVPHAWLMIGEYYFENADRDGPEQIRDNLLLALDAFEEAGSQRGRESLTDANYIRAIYSWAWAHYRLENYPQAIGVFREVVDLVDAIAQETGERRDILREDAIAHLAEILAMEDWELDGTAAFDDTVMSRVEDYMSEGDDYERDVLVLLGDELFDFLRFDEAIEVYEHLMEEEPLHPDNPQIHAKIVAALHRDYREEEAFAVRRELINYYGRDSAWYEHQQRVGNEAALREMENMVRDYLLMAATWYHEQAQTQRNEAMVSRDSALLALTEEKYARAADAYYEFLQQFPNDREIFQWNFYYAECLYYSANYQDAFEQYQVVRELDIPDNPFQEVSAFNAIQALEFVMRQQIDDGELTAVALAGSDFDQARDAADDIEEERQFGEDEVVEQIDVDGMPIPSITMNYVTAMDRYVVLGLENQEDEYLGAKFAFQAAKVFHDFEHYDESRRRFAWVVDQYPEHEVAYLSGSLILESFRRQNDFEGLTEWAEKLEGVIRGEQAEAVRAEVREYRLSAMFRSAEEMLNEQRYEDAAQEFINLAREEPDHRLAPRARNNAASVYEIAGNYDRAIEQYEELFRQYPDDDLAGRAVYRVAVNSEWLFDYDKAVRHYQLFYDQFSGPTPEALEAMNFDIEESRQESLLQAAQMHDYLQRYPEAARTFEQYYETYPESEFAAETLWAAADSWEKAGDDAAMVRTLERFLDEFEGDRQRADRLITARARIARLHEGRGQQAQADVQYRIIIDQFHEWTDEDEASLPGEASIRETVAESRFMLVERQFEEWDRIAITGTLQQQNARIEEKLEGAEEIQDAYEEVLQYQNLDWNLAARFRLANVLHRVANALYDVPVPFEEGSEEYWVYQDMLDDLAFPMEDAAIEQYEDTIARARENEIVNEWTERTLEALHDFQPSDYPFYESERRPRQARVSHGIPLLSYEGYQKRQERQEWGDDEGHEALESDGGGDDGGGNGS